MKVAYAKKLAQLLIASGSPFLFFGCIEPEPQDPLYTPKALEPQSRGITVVTSTPYNCKVLGEVEGKDNVLGTRGTTRERLREGAMNDLKNTAAATANLNNRIMIKITKESMRCSITLNGRKQEIPCTYGYELNKLPPQVAVYPLSHRIHADVYDCGEK